MRTRVLMATLFTGMVVLIAPGAVRQARAQQTGFVVNRFEPAERGSDWFSLDSLDLRSKRDASGNKISVFPAVGVTGDYNYRSLVVYNPDDTVRASIVRNQLIMHAGASIALVDRVRFGVDMPFQLFADGHQGAVRGQVFNAPSNDQALGDLRLGVDLRVYGVHGDPFTVAIGAQAALPTGDRSSYMSDGSVRVLPRVQVAGDLGPVAYAARLGFQYRGLGQSYAGSPIGSEFNYAISLGVRALDRKLLIGPEFFGSTVVTDGAAFSKQATPLEGIMGIHVHAGDFLIGAGVGAGLTRGFGAPLVRTLLSFEWAPAFDNGPPPVVAPIDTDGDGINDTEDACKTTPGVRTNDPKTNGCPPADQDRDGIFDKDDACIDVPGVKSDDPKKNGCPPDKDGDGVYDKDDACIDVPGVKSDDPKKNGCPPDKDNDGVPDADDACPDIAGIKSTNPKFNGCPADRDNDGVLNEVDACPDEPGKPDPDPKKNGCPKAFVQNGQIKILDQVKFKTASAQILPGKDSEEVLQAVLKVINDHPEIKKLRVEGHTDNRGAAPYNQTLSASRAASVVKWLVAHGVDATHLTSVGFGQDKPIARNDTEDGRRENRRVEFHIDEETK